MLRPVSDPPLSGFGLGLRQPHFEQALKTTLPVEWFEIVSENFMDAHDGYWQFLARLRAKYPLVMHGVALNIGSPDPLNREYLQKLMRLAEWVNPAFISDHLCWTGIHGVTSHDLLPVPYTEEALGHIADRVKQVQDVLGRHLVLENPSTYAEFTASTMPEWEFLARLAERADCQLLLDVNNVYVGAFNHRYDAAHYIDAIPADRIAYLHLAGHKHHGTHIVDTHDEAITDAVWNLYRHTMRKLGPVPTMIEWDSDIPPMNVLLTELDKARTAAGQAA